MHMGYPSLAPRNRYKLQQHESAQHSTNTLPEMHLTSPHVLEIEVLSGKLPSTLLAVRACKVMRLRQPSARAKSERTGACNSMTGIPVIGVSEYQPCVADKAQARHICHWAQQQLADSRYLILPNKQVCPDKQGGPQRVRQRKLMQATHVSVHNRNKYVK